jgi:hypothetical protein
MALVLFALMLSLGSSGQGQNALRLSIARIEATNSKSSSPQFAVTLENQGDSDFVLVLGYMLGNGREMIPSAISLGLIDQQGRTCTLVYRAPPVVGRRIDDYTVALRHYSSHTLRVSLGDYYARGELGSHLASGTYTIQAIFDGRAAGSSNADMLGIRLINFWTGAVSSNVLRFSVPQPPGGADQSLISSEERSALIKALHDEALLHRRHDVAMRRGEKPAPLVDPERLPQLAEEVGQLHDAASIPALATALGSGFAVIRPLAVFGEQAVPAILAVEASPESSTSAINDALITLRFIVEGAATARGGLSEAMLADLRRVAARRLAREDGSPTTLWWAIDLAWSLRDKELQQTVQALASDPRVVVERGITDPQLIEQTQRRAADRVAGLPALPRP